MENDKSGEETEEFILNAINDSIGQLVTKQRTKARLAGQTTFHVRITLSELADLVKSRLDGLRGVELAPDDLPMFDELDDDEVVESVDVDMPSNAELRDRWLPMIVEKIGGATLDHDGTIEFDSEVPPPRNAHAR